MGPPIAFLAAFAAIFIAQAAHGAVHFQRGHTLEYKYYADVKAGTDDPAPYASEFSIQAKLRITDYNADATLTPLKNVFHVQLSDIQTGMHNGAAQSDHLIETLSPIGEDVAVLHQPFLIIYDTNGLLLGVKIPADEPGWSKNMKIAMASMLQLDLASIEYDFTWRQNFVSQESTIHGNCSVAYNVFRKEGTPTNEYFIMKFTSPTNCTGFSSQSFNHVDVDSCQPIKEEPLNVDSKRSIVIHKTGDEIRITKLFAQSAIKYLPWNRLTRAHYAITNATFILDQVLPMVPLPATDFLSMPIIRDLTYQQPLGRYAPNAAVDPTQGRHVVDLARVVPELRKMLEEAVDYMEENHLKMEVPNWKHGHTINRILSTMSLMDIPSLELVFHTYQDSKIPQDVTIKNLFLDMIPQVGTPATSLFTMRIVRKSKVPDSVAIEMLKNLPQNVKSPSPKLLQQLEDLLRFDTSVTVNVRKASILCFSSLMYRTFKDAVRPTQNLLLQKYLREFLTHVKDDSRYDMKVVYLMAMRNVEVGEIDYLLEPIITGELSISEKPVHIRVLAIWAAEKVLAKDRYTANRLLFPIMADVELPLRLRLAAYDILIRMSDEDLLHRIDWFMATETDKHFRNYHYTTVKNFAQADDPCKKDIRQHMERILRFDKKDGSTRLTLSSAYYFDEYDSNLGVSEKFDGALVLDDKTGDPEVVRFEYYLTSGPESIVDTGIRLNIEGLSELKSSKMFSIFTSLDFILDPKVLQVLAKAARDLPPAAEVHIDVVLTRGGRVVLANHYDRMTFFEMHRDVMPYVVGRPKADFNLNHRTVRYDQLSQKRVISDMGFPVVMDSRVPVAASLKFNYDVLPITPNDETQTVGVDLSLDLKIWRYGEYSLSTYNPIADAWHSTQRHTAVDFSLPLRAIVSLSPVNNTLKIRFPPLAESRNPIAGLRVYIKDSVTVEAKNGAEKLRISCPTCEVQEDVRVDHVETTKWSDKHDSELTGLRTSLAVLDCQLGKRADPTSLYESFVRPSVGDQWLAEGEMTTRQKVKRMFLYPQIGNCGVLMKIEPSKVFPGYSVEIKLSRKATPDDTDNPSYFVLRPQTYNLEATIDVISSGITHGPDLSLSAKLDINMNDGHTLNTAKLLLKMENPTVVPQTDENARICIFAQKSYQEYTSDFLSLKDAAKQETHSLLTIGYARGAGDECDVSLVNVTVKGELSNDQLDRIGRRFTRPCMKDMLNRTRHGYGRTGEHIRMTRVCLNEAITHTTLRKYTIDIHQKESSAIEKYHMFRDRKSSINSALWPYVQLDLEAIGTDITRLHAEFPLGVNPSDIRDFASSQWLSNYKRRGEESEDDVEPIYNFPLDNTRFSTEFLDDYTDDAIRLCVVDSRITWTADEKSVPFELPTRWTLVTGEHVQKNFAVFAKYVSGSEYIIAAKVYTGGHHVEILPNDNGDIRVTLDGLSIDDKLAGNSSVLTNDAGGPQLTVTRTSQFVIVDFPQVPSLSVVYHPLHLMVTIHSFLLQGKVSGLCGHLDGTYRTNIPEFYTLD